MGKDPAFMLYSQDFLVGVSDLTMEERGQYITLLCTEHQKGRLSKKVISLTVGTASEDVLSKFDIDEDGLYYNERLEEEIEKRERYSKSRSENGSKGGRPKKEAQENHMETICLPYEKAYDKAHKNHSENENVNDNDIKNKRFNISIIKKEFEEIWLLYPNKKGKDRAYSYYEKARRSGLEFEFIKQKVLDYATECDIKKLDKRYIAHGSTWFSQSRWNDDCDLTIPREEENGNGFDDWAKRLIGG